MDKRGTFPTPEELLCTLPEKEIDEAPRKVTLIEYLSSKKKMAFRSAQEQNPIKGKPRRKRGRKAR